MSRWKPGDVVSLSSRQLTRVTITAVPPGPGPSTYTVGLPINGVQVAYSVQALPGATRGNVAAGLLAVLLQQQTVYLGILGGDGVSVLLAGPMGVQFAANALTGNLTASMVQAAVQAVNTRTGENIGPVRVIESENSLERLREFASRDRSGHLIPYINTIRGRELDSSNVFDFDSTQILATVSTVAGGPSDPFQGLT